MTVSQWEIYLVEILFLAFVCIIVGLWIALRDKRKPVVTITTLYGAYLDDAPEPKPDRTDHEIELARKIH